MNHFHLVRRQFVLRLAILGLVTCGSLMSTVTTAQEPSTTGPLLLDGYATSAPGSARVTGQNFTPGGAVYVALYDQWGMELHETRWVTASATAFGPHGSQDPANGYAPGGTIEETFGTIEPVFGPHGSQDPARGYVAGNPGREVALNLCGAAIMVRAYDAQTETWSNVLDIDSGC